MLKNIPSIVNKSSILPVTITLETEYEVQLMYELLGRFHFKDMRKLLGDCCSDSEWGSTILDIYNIRNELKEAGYKHAEGKLQMSDISE